MKERSRRAERQEAARDAANALAREAAEEADRHSRQPPEAPPATATTAALTAASAETDALRDFHAIAQAFPDRPGWDGETAANNNKTLDAHALGGPPPALPMPERLLSPANGIIPSRARSPRRRNPAITPIHRDTRSPQDDWRQYRDDPAPAPETSYAAMERRQASTTGPKVTHSDWD